MITCSLKKFALISLIIIVSSCASTAGYRNVLTTWINESVDNLVLAWGPPQSTYTLSNGTKLLQYTNQNAYQSGGYFVGGSRYSPGTYIPQTTNFSTCKTVFMASKRDIIIDAKFEGNGCVADYP